MKKVKIILNFADGDNATGSATIDSTEGQLVLIDGKLSVKDINFIATVIGQLKNNALTYPTAKTDSSSLPSKKSKYDEDEDEEEYDDN